MTKTKMDDCLSTNTYVSKSVNVFLVILHRSMASGRKFSGQTTFNSAV